MDDAALLGTAVSDADFAAKTDAETKPEQQKVGPGPADLTLVNNVSVLSTSSRLRPLN
jgi:hypothetical protein